jgi:DNA repair protein RecO (recombination protein O)
VEKSRAILLRRHLLGDTSLILHWCTESHGIVKTAAKGARTPRSAFAGRLDLFFSCDIAWARARRGDLHALREVELLAPRAGLRASYPRTLAAAYFVALVEASVEREAPVPEIHGLLARALDWLDGSEPSPAALLRFESRIAEILGIAPPGSPGAAALLDTLQRLPPQRDELFRMLFRENRT